MTAVLQAPADSENAQSPESPRAGRIRQLGWAGLAGLLWTGILLARLFVGGAIGMGDQGDGRRLMCQLGVRNAAPFSANRSAFLYPTWIPHHWFGEACSADGAGGVYRSSELALLSLARLLTPVLGLPGALDLRALGVVCSIVVGLCVAVLVVAVPGPLLLRLSIASAVGLLAADSAVAQFLVSPYSEAAGLLGCLALVPALLLLWRRGHTTWPTLLAVGFLSAFTLGSKTQAVGLLPALVAALVWLPHWRHRSWLAARLPGLVLSALLVCLGAYFAATSPQGFSQQNVYGQVFGTILPNSHDPAADLRSLGADPSLADASGSNRESPHAASQRLAYLTFRDEVTATTVLRFYVTHPVRLAGLGGAGLHGVAHWEQDYLGSYLPDSGRAPLSIERRVDVYGGLFRGAFPALLALFWIGTVYVGVRTVRDRRLTTHEQALGRLALFVAAGAFCEFWTIMLVAGFPDVYKHMIYTNLLLALGLPVMAACATVRLRAFLQRDRT